MNSKFQKLKINDEESGVGSRTRSKHPVHVHPAHPVTARKKKATKAKEDHSPTQAVAIPSDVAIPDDRVSSDHESHNGPDPLIIDDTFEEEPRQQTVYSKKGES